MSMLAERKVKDKWCLNPRGNTWSNDSSKFGQKMLEKMGWSKGKGLGRNEDGAVDSIKVPFKNDSKGIGFKERNDQWTVHDTNFNALLQSLSGEKSKDTTIKMSLEAKSQTSRVRVHYKKFTRGKDLSRCSKKDLACIFGKKSFDTPTAPETEEVKETGWFQHSGSMVDYFQKKLPGYGKSNGYVVGSNGVLKKASNLNSENEERLGVGFSGKKRKSEEAIDGIPKKKKKKEEENEEMQGVSNPAFNPLFNRVNVEKHVLNTIAEEIEEEDNAYKKNSITKLKTGTAVKKCKSFEDDSNSVKKKKKSVLIKENQESSDSGIKNLKDFAVQKKSKNEIKENGVENPNFDKFASECDEIVCHNKYEVKRKIKKVKVEEENGVDNPNFVTSKVQKKSNDKFEVKRKKNQKDISGIENLNFDSSVGNGNTQNNKFEVKRNNDEKKKLKKKIEKKLREEMAGIENINFENESTHNNKLEVKRKNEEKNKRKNTIKPNTDKEKVKKTKSDKNGEIGIENPNFNSSKEETNCHNNEYEVKRKTKKKSEEGVDNPYFNNTKEETTCNNNEFEVKRKKRKMKTEENSVETKKIEDSGQNEDPIFDLMLNVAVKPVPEKLESSRRKSVRFSDVNEERIIPNKEEIQERTELFDINSRVIENSLKEANSRTLDESIRKISSKIDNFQCQIENDINKTKVTKTKRSPKTPNRQKVTGFKSKEKFYGKVGTLDGDNQILPTGETLLRFKYAKFGRTPPYLLRNDISGAKKSYKHLIKGDIVVAFKNTNLHEVRGYGLESSNK